MENLDIKIEKEKEYNKISFFKKHKTLFKLISITLGNVVFKYQLEELMLRTKYIKGKKEFNEFIVQSIHFDLLKEDNFDNTDKVIYIVRDYVLQNVSNVKKATYKYNKIDTITSYYKMSYILETVKNRPISNEINLNYVASIFLKFSTFHINKTSYCKLYKELNDRKKLNILGEKMLLDLEFYENKKLLNFKNSKLNKLFEDEIYMEQLRLTCDRIKGDKKFWDYNLGKISDNKSHFLFFNPSDTTAYKNQSLDTIDIVKFDVSNNLENAILGDYITKVMESIKLHIKEEYKNINIYVYFADEDRKIKTFNNSVSHKLNRNGVKNLDSNLTARIKETSRKVYQTRLISFANPIIDFKNYIVSYNIYYKSQNQALDEFYTLTLNFRNSNFEDDIYSKEEQEQKKRAKERKRKEKEADRILNDTEILELLIKKLEGKN